jgi:hypothetical protein
LGAEGSEATLGVGFEAGAYSAGRPTDGRSSGGRGAGRCVGGRDAVSVSEGLPGFGMRDAG